MRRNNSGWPLLLLSTCRESINGASFMQLVSMGEETNWYLIDIMQVLRDARVRRRSIQRLARIDEGYNQLVVGHSGCHMSLSPDYFCLIPRQTEAAGFDASTEIDVCKRKLLSHSSVLSLTWGLLRDLINLPRFANTLYAQPQRYPEPDFHIWPYGFCSVTDSKDLLEMAPRELLGFGRSWYTIIYWDNRLKVILRRQRERQR